jgi:4-amino-4-deoxy-L-arabinose transferase-like glycosyltransferase
LILKLLLAALIPLSADEAYYWVWSHRLQLSYFDHPPMVAWLFTLGHFLEPFGHAVRWPAVILGHLTLLVWYFILRKHCDLQKIKIWLYLALFSPIIGFGSLIVTPDLPLVFFWSLSLLFFQEALENSTWKNYVGLGVSLGLGFCAKYHIVLFVPAVFIALFFNQNWKRIQWKYVPLTVIFGILFCAPVLIWNYQNHFASFAFQLHHGLERPEYNPEWTWSYLAGQIGILFPLIVYAAIRAKIPAALKHLLAFAWLPLVFFFLTSFKALVEANWPIAAYTGVFALALFYPRIKTFSKIYVGFFGFVYVVVITALFVPSLRTLNEKLNEPFYYENLSVLAKEYRPLYGSSYQMSASLWYFAKTPVFKLKDISRFDFFDTLPEAVPQNSRFYLLMPAGKSLPPWISEQQWQYREIKKVSPNYVVLEFTHL